MIDIILDSGAYSAFHSGKKIDIDAYAAFIKKHGKLFFNYFNLDVIRNGEKSVDNWHYLRKKGADTIPVYHLKTNEDFLINYLKETDYLGIGMTVSLNKEKRIQTMDQMWKKYFLNSKGEATCKVHGLGLTDFDVIKRYPWYSVDSFTPNIAAAWGGIFMPVFRANKPDYNNMLTLKVSEQGNHMGSNLNSWARLPKQYQKQCLELIESKKFEYAFGQVFYQKKTPRRGKTQESLPNNHLFDVTEEEVNKTTIAGDWVVRMKWNLEMWAEMKKMMPVAKFKIGKESFEHPTKLFIGASSSTMLEAVGAKRYFDILISYAYFNKEDKKFEMLKSLNK